MKVHNIKLQKILSSSPLATVCSLAGTNRLLAPRRNQCGRCMLSRLLWVKVSLKHRVVSNLVNNHTMSSWFDRKESFDGEKTSARVMRRV